MNKYQKQTKAIAYLRQLCCSGLPKELVILEFLRAVREVLPSDANAFTDTEKEFRPDKIVFEHGYDNSFEFTQVVMGYWIPERTQRFATWFMRHSVLINHEVFDVNFYSSDLYQYGYRKYNQHHTMVASVMHSGRPIGMMTLNRPKNKATFNTVEQAIFAKLMPYVAHAMKAPQNQEIDYCGNGAMGMMIMNADGAILFQSQAAQKLLDLASHPIIKPDASRQKADLLAKLARLCRNLDSIFRGGDAAPPSFCHVNGLGRFIFRAQWLEQQRHGPDGLIGMMVEHQEPLLIKILRALCDLPLSPIQKEVASLVAQGASNEKICQALHIKLTTVKDHIQKIFVKLDIQQREELLPKLLEGEKERLVHLL